MRILLTRYFARWAKREGLSYHRILKAVEELRNGLNDGNLDGELIEVIDHGKKN